MFLIRQCDEDEVLKGVKDRAPDYEVSQDDMTLKLRAANISFEQVNLTMFDKLPARGKFCTHVECFDAEEFVRAQKKLKSWKCPICNKIAVSMKIDTFLMDVKNWGKLMGTNNDATIYPNGSFKLEDKIINPTRDRAFAEKLMDDRKFENEILLEKKLKTETGELRLEAEKKEEEVKPKRGWRSSRRGSKVCPISI